MLRVISSPPENQLRCVACQIPLVLGVDFLAHFWLLLKAWTFLREFILGDNETGLVTDSDTLALGGEDPEYAGNTLAEGPEVYQGSYTTTSTYYFPSQTVASWDQFIQNPTSSKTSVSLSQSGGASGKIAGGVLLKVLGSVFASFWFACVWLF
jgi:hypothetical protein